jgi:hypothetical protein
MTSAPGTTVVPTMTAASASSVIQSGTTIPTGSTSQPASYLFGSSSASSSSGRFAAYGTLAALTITSLVIAIGSTLFIRRRVNTEQVS